MIHLLTAIHIGVCVLLVLVVLLQQGKKDGMGAAFGGGSQSVFGARGAETFLEKLTKVLAVVFMATSLGLVYYSTRESSDSLLSKEAAPVQSAPTTSTPSATTDAQSAPANSTPSPEKPSTTTTK